MAKQRKSASRSSKATKPRLYTFDVFITSGPISAKFAKANPEIVRIIQIRGDQTLENLHEAIFEAFDRSDAHMYEFQFGEREMEGPRYVLPMVMEAPYGNDRPAGTVDETTIESLGLKMGRAFGYWFDFGDDWWHQIEVMAIEDDVPLGKYPSITKRIGKSPPQYMR